MGNLSLLRNQSNGFKLGMFIVFFVLFLLLSGLFQQFYLMYEFGKDAIGDINILNNLDDSKNLNAAKVNQIVGSVIIFFLPPFLLALFFSNKPIKYLGFKKLPSKPSIFIAIILCFSVLPFIEFSGMINSKVPFPEFMSQLFHKLEDSAMHVTKKFLEMDSISDLFFNLFMMALIPAVGEELFFRGALQKLLIKSTKKEFLGVLLTAFIFSAIHVQFLSFLPRFFLGILLGYLYIWSKSLWLPILFHFINNGMAVVLAYFIGFDESIQITSKDIDLNSILIVFASILVSAFLIKNLYVYKRSKKEEYS